MGIQKSSNHLWLPFTATSKTLVTIWSSGVCEKELPHVPEKLGRNRFFNIDGVDLKAMRDVAKSLCKAGGVGYYARSNFIHIDTYWSSSVAEAWWL
ncbi:DUF882 domain-containing protein [Vibrio chagasii]|nr:DUF882 domain-containing protein [Vibrio chagasii]